MFSWLVKTSLRHYAARQEMFSWLVKTSLRHYAARQEMFSWLVKTVLNLSEVNQAGKGAKGNCCAESISSQARLTIKSVISRSLRCWSTMAE